MVNIAKKSRLRFAFRALCLFALIGLFNGLIYTDGITTAQAAGPRQRVIFVQGINSSYGQGGDEPFADIKNVLVHDYEYDRSDFIDFSYNVESYKGYDTDIRPFQYDCVNTGQPLRASSATLRQLMTNVHRAFPNDEFVLVGHSMGGYVITRALWAGQNDRWRSSVAGIVTLNSPLFGVSTSDLSPHGKSLAAREVENRLGAKCRNIILTSDASHDLQSDFEDFERNGERSSVRIRLRSALRDSYQQGVRIGTFGINGDCLYNHAVCDTLWLAARNLSWVQVYRLTDTAGNKLNTGELYDVPFGCQLWFNSLCSPGNSFHSLLVNEPRRSGMLNVIGRQGRQSSQTPGQLPNIDPAPRGNQPGQQPQTTAPVNPPNFTNLTASASTVDVDAGGRTDIRVTATYSGGAGTIPCGLLNLGVVGDARADLRADGNAPGAWELHGWRSHNRVAADGCRNEARPGQTVAWNVQLYVPPERQPGTYLIGEFAPVFDGRANGWSSNRIRLSARVSYGRPVFSDLQAFSSNTVTVTAGDRVGVDVVGRYEGASGSIPCGLMNLGVVNDEDARFRADEGAEGAWEQHGWRSKTRVAADGCLGNVSYGQEVRWTVQLSVPPNTPTGQHLVGTFSPVYDAHDPGGWADVQIPIYVNVTERRPIFSDLEAFSSSNVVVSPDDHVTIVVAGTYEGGAGNIPCGQLNLGVVGDIPAEFRDDMDVPGATEPHGWRSVNRVAAAGCDGEANGGEEIQWHVKLHVPPGTAAGTYPVGTFAPVVDAQWGDWAASQISLWVTVPGPDVKNLRAYASNDVTVTAGDQVTIVVIGDYLGGAGNIPCALFNLGVVDDLSAAFRADEGAPGAWEQHGWRSENRVAAAGCIGEAAPGQEMQWHVKLMVPPDTAPGTYPVGRFSPVFDTVDQGWSGNTIDLSVVVTSATGQPDDGSLRFDNLTAFSSNEISVAAGERASIIVTGSYNGGKGPIPCDQLNLGVVDDADASFRDDADPAGGWRSANRVAPRGCDGEVVEGEQVEWLVPLSVPAETAPGSHLVGNFSPVYDGVDNGWAAGQISLFVAVAAPVTTVDVAASPTPPPAEAPLNASTPEDTSSTLDVVVEATVPPSAEGTATQDPALTETVAPEPTLVETPEVATETTTTMETPAVGGEVLPPEFAGTWAGTATQVNPAGEFPLTITFTGGGLEETVATIDYPDDDCGGELRLDRIDPGSIQLEERVFEPGPNCVDGGAMTLTLNPDGTMDYSWNTADGATSAGATLELTSGPGDVPTEPTGDATSAAPTEPDLATSKAEPTEPVTPVETPVIEPIGTDASESFGDSLPAEYAGTWEGIAVQDNPPDEFPLTITFTGSTIGEVVATIEYPSYDCTGELTLDRVETDRGRIVLLEDITVGEGVCADGGSLALYAETDGSLTFLWSSADSSLNASAALTLVGDVTDTSIGSDDGSLGETPEPAPDDGAEDNIDEGDAWVPQALEDLLPGESDLPVEVSLTIDEERTQDELATLFGPDPNDSNALLQEWGWLANTYREFGAESAAADPFTTTSLSVSAYQFDSESGASQALDYFMTDSASTYGIAETPVGLDAGLEPLGDEARALAGPSDDENMVILYVRIDAFMVRVSGTSPSGDPMADVETLARTLLSGSTESPDVVVDESQPDLDTGIEEPDAPDDGTTIIQSNDEGEPEPPDDQSDEFEDPVITEPENESPEPLTEDPAAEGAERAAIELSQLEASRDFDALYDTMHPDAQAIIPREVVVGWYGDDLASKDAGELTVTAVRFVDWTWDVNGVTYANTAEIDFVQPYFENGVQTDVTSTVRLAEVDGQWRWFFGPSREFVDAQIEEYAP